MNASPSRDMANTTTIQWVDAARQFGAFAGFVGLLAGISYGVGGWIYDASTDGINHGSYLALNAIWAMPFLFAPGGVVAGVLWAPLWTRIPTQFGGHPSVNRQRPPRPE